MAVIRGEKRTETALEKLSELPKYQYRAMRKFIRAESLAGNWSRIYAFACFALTEDGSLSLYDWKREKYLTNFSCSHDAFGYTSDKGTNKRIDTNFLGTTDHRGNSDNQIQGVYWHDYTRPVGSGTIWPFGTVNATTNFAVRMDHTGLGNRNRFYVFGGEFIQDFVVPLKSTVCIDSNLQRMVLNGVELNPTVSSTQGSNFPSANYYVVGANDNGSVQEFDGTISTWMIANAEGFDHLAHHNNLTQLMTDLGLDIDYFSTEAQAVLDRFSNPLSQREQVAVARFVDSQVTSGNWSLISEFQHYGMTDASNARTGWKAYNATENNGPVHVSGVGYEFDAANSTYLDTGIDPSTATDLEDALAGTFIYKPQTDDTFTQVFLGSGISFNNTNTEFQLRSLNRSRFTINNGQPTNTFNNLFRSYKQLYVMIREDSSTNDIYVNGSFLDTNNDTVSATKSQYNYYVGAANRSDVALNYWGPGTLSMFVAGKAVGFDHSDFYTNLVTLNEELFNAATT